MLESLITVAFNIDQNLALVVQEYGIWTYLILFLIIFLETGFVIMPFLPGDSLLFVGGAAAAGGILDPLLLMVVIILGAVIGDTVNYWIGNYLGVRVFLERFPTLVRKEYIDQTYAFFEKYGGATIFVARFVPLVRTFAPFLAGVGTMHYRRFLFYNVSGAICWTVSIVLAGYFFGTIGVVQENMGLLIIAVILLMVGTVLLIIAKIIRGWWDRRQNRRAFKKKIRGGGQPGAPGCRPWW
jgi:membrane-associated protein